jgi:hypothetical protein
MSALDKAEPAPLPAPLSRATVAEYLAQMWRADDSNARYYRNGAISSAESFKACAIPFEAVCAAYIAAADSLGLRAEFDAARSVKP